LTVAKISFRNTKYRLISSASNYRTRSPAKSFRMVGQCLVVDPLQRPLTGAVDCSPGVIKNDRTVRNYPPNLVSFESALIRGRRRPGVSYSVETEWLRLEENADAKRNRDRCYRCTDECHTLRLRLSNEEENRTDLSKPRYSEFLTNHISDHSSRQR